MNAAASQSDKDNETEKYEATPTTMAVPRVLCTELFRKRKKKYMSEST